MSGIEGRFESDLLRNIKQGDGFTILTLMTIPGTSFAECAEDSHVLAKWLYSECKKRDAGLVQLLQFTETSRLYMLAPTAIGRQRTQHKKYGSSLLYTRYMHPENRIQAMYRELDGRDYSYSRPPIMGGFQSSTSLRFFLRQNKRRGYYTIVGLDRQKMVRWNQNACRSLVNKGWIRPCKYTLDELVERVYVYTEGKSFLPFDVHEALGMNLKLVRQALAAAANAGWLKTGRKYEYGHGISRVRHYYRDWRGKSHAKYRHLLAEGEGK